MIQRTVIRYAILQCTLTLIGIDSDPADSHSGCHHLLHPSHNTLCQEATLQQDFQQEIQQDSQHDQGDQADAPQVRGKCIGCCSKLKGAAADA